MALITRLLVDGDVVTGKEESSEYWMALCTRLLEDVSDLDKEVTYEGKEGVVSQAYAGCATRRIRSCPNA